MNETEDQFMARMKDLFAAGRHNEILDAWGADTSRSHDFKAAAFDGYESTAHDVVVSTYPKSGTTWAMQIAYQIGYLGDGNFRHFDDVVPWPDKLIPMNDPDLDDVRHLADSPTKLHVIKSHLETNYVPIDGAGKFITVIRNPADVLASVIQFENGFNELLFGDIVPAQAFAEMFITDRFMYQQWPAFVDSWWRLRDRDNVLVLFYEDMRADSNAAIETIADFVEVELTPAQFAAVAAKSSFDWMKENDHRFAPPAWEQGQVSLVRTGKVGSSKNALSDGERARIDEWCASEFERLGSDLPWAERYGN